MTRTVCAICLVIAVSGVGCAPKAAASPAAQATAAEEPAVESEQGGDPSVASEDFETGSSETLQGAEKTATEQPAGAP